MMLSANNITIGYGRPLVSGISFSIGAGECILLCGANGTGKSTLLRTLASLVKPLAGTVVPDCEVVMMPSGISKVKGFTSREFMRTGLYGASVRPRYFGKGHENSIDNAIDALDLGRLADKDISELSDGEFRKVCVASALSRKAGVILLDEPTAFLDVENRIFVLAALKDICSRSGCSVIFSSHDISDSIKICSRVFGISTEKRFIDSDVYGPAEKVTEACFRNISVASL